MKTKKCFLPIIWSIIGLFLFTIPAFAEESSSISALADSSTEMIGEMLGLLMPMMRMIGIVLLVMGMMRFVMSFMNEDPEAKVQAIMSIITATVVIAMPMIFGTIFDMPTDSNDTPYQQEVIIEEIEI